MILTHFHKLPKNVEDLGKLFVGKGFKKLPKSSKSPNLVTLVTILKVIVSLIRLDKFIVLVEIFI